MRASRDDAPKNYHGKCPKTHRVTCVHYRLLYALLLLYNLRMCACAVNERGSLSDVTVFALSIVLWQVVFKIRGFLEKQGTVKSEIFTLATVVWYTREKHGGIYARNSGLPENRVYIDVRTKFWFKFQFVIDDERNTRAYTVIFTPAVAMYTVWILMKLSRAMNVLLNARNGRTLFENYTIGKLALIAKIV